MIYSFFSCEVNKDGELIPKEESANYKLFSSPVFSTNQHLKIYQKEEAMKYFGCYPVIYLNFFTSKCISTYSEAINKIREVIHLAYKSHNYLCTSTKVLIAGHSLSTICNKWCNSLDYLDLPESLISSGLQTLAECLKIHYEKEIITLIDEYDSLCCAAMFSVDSNSELDKIIKFFVECIAHIIKPSVSSKLYCIKFAFLTGISRILTTGLKGINNISYYSFLQSKDFAPFYGLTEAEVEDIKTRYLKKVPEAIPMDELQLAENYYNGYIAGGNIKIFSIWSYLKFLQSQELKSHWKQSGICHFLDSTIWKNESVRNSLKDLLGGESKQIRINFTLGTDDIIYLQKIKNQNIVESGAEDLLYNFYLEQGYLSLDNTDFNSNEEVYVCIPNNEIKQFISQELQKYLSVSLICCKRKVSELWKCLSFDTSENLIEALKVLKNEINDILLNDEFTSPNRTCLQSFIVSTLNKNDFLCLENVTIGVGKKGCVKPDIVLKKKTSNCLVVIELKYNDSLNAAFKQIITKNYTLIGHNEKYFGSKLPEKFIAIGINMHKDGKKIDMGIIKKQITGVEAKDDVIFSMDDQADLKNVYILL